MKMNPIFYMSSERSGTNVFRNILDSNSNAFFPHNPAIFEEFKEILHNYTSKEELVFDVIGLIRFNQNPWSYIPQEEMVLERLESIDLFELIRIIYELCAEHYQVNFVGLKNINYSKGIEELYLNFEEPKFIYQFRDPRDCAASWLTINSGPKHVYHGAIRWNEEQNNVKKIFNQLDEKGDIFSFSYENLVSNSKHVIEDVCSFLKMKFEDQMLDFYKTKEAKKSSSMHKAWNNLSKPMMTSNFNKFEKNLNPEQIYIVEKICCKNMDRLGYELKNPDLLVEEVIPFTESEIKSFDTLNNKLRQENFLKSERNYRKERKDYYRLNLKNKFS